MEHENRDRDHPELVIVSQMEDSATKLRLQWRDHGNELSQLSREIFGNDDLTDVTLTCLGGSPYHAHKMVLAAASTFFRNFFKEIQCKM